MKKSTKGHERNSNMKIGFAIELSSLCYINLKNMVKHTLYIKFYYHGSFFFLWSTQAFSSFEFFGGNYAFSSCRLTAVRSKPV